MTQHLFGHLAGEYLGVSAIAGLGFVERKIGSLKYATDLGGLILDNMKST
jgi:hypothetical protein